MPPTKKQLREETILQFRKLSGRNPTDPPHDLAPDMAQDMVNVDMFQATIARKRPGATSDTDLFGGITFVDNVYLSLPKVYRLKNFEELPEAIRSSLKKTADPTISRNFKQNLENNTFEFSWDDLSLDMAKKFFYGGFFGGVQISSKQMEEFMKEKQHVFEFLADEHLKKINQYKKSKYN